jgi:POT family proton-dependent oligopeptide transporter
MNTNNQFPKGIPYIIGNEAAERFSYYGMKAILIVFMTSYLKMSENESTIWFHSFGIGVFWFPIIGAIIAEVFLGKYKTIMSLSVVYVLGHFVLALFETKTGLAVGLSLIAIGSGGIKPCVSAHVGDQFTHKNKHLIERMFSYFYLSINMGAFISTLATPLLLQFYGPSIAFGIPGVLMFIATILFWMGRHKFIAIRPFGKEIIDELKDKSIVKTILQLLVIYAFIGVFWSLFEQTSSTWILQARNSLILKDFSLFGNSFTLLPSQIQAANPILVLIFVPVFTFLIYPIVNKIVKVTPLRKITFGMLIAGFSFIIVAWIENRIQQGIETHIYWQFIAYAILTAAEIMVSITALEFSYTQAPNKLKSIIMGLFLLSVSLGNTIATVVNKFIVVEETTSFTLTTGDKTFIELDQLAKNYSAGDKIEFKESVNIFLAADQTLKTEKKPFIGTFVLENFNNNTAEIVNAMNRSSIKTTENENGITKLYKYSLQGADYFYFFAYLMIITAFIFIFVATLYKEKTYIQDVSDIE